MKRRNIIRIFVIVCALCLLPVFGRVNTFAGEASGYVVTTGSVELSSAETNSIMAKMKSVAETTGLDMVVLICRNLEESGAGSAQALADDYYDNNGFGENGVLFLWLIDEQTAHISTTAGTAARILYDNAQANIWADMQSTIKSGDYAAAFDIFGNDVLNYYNEYLEDAANQEKAGPNYGLSAIIAVVVGAISGLIRGGSLKSELKSVAVATTAKDCIKKDSFNLTRSADVFLYRSVEKTKRSDSSENKSSELHTASSGQQHGGNTFK